MKKNSTLSDLRCSDYLSNLAVFIYGEESAELVLKNTDSRELETVLTGALKALDDRNRDIIMSRCKKFETFREIAERYQVTHAAIMRSLERAISRLKEDKGVVRLATRAREKKQDSRFMAVKWVRTFPDWPE